MKIIIEELKEKSKKSLKVNIGDIVVLDKNCVDFKDLGKSLVDSNHMFYVYRIVDNGYRICVISSNMNHVSNKFPSNCPILDWKEAGLRKASYVNGNSDGHVSKECIKYKVGHVSNRDFRNILKAIKTRKFVNQKIEDFGSINEYKYFYL